MIFQLSLAREHQIYYIHSLDYVFKTPEMDVIIETERLLLRELKPGDAEGMYELDSDPLVHQYVGRKPVQTIDESKRVIEIIRQQYVTNGIGRWAVIEKHTGSFMGWGGLKLITEPIDGRVGHLDVGYRFIPRYWGNGYAKETAKAAVHYATTRMSDLAIHGIAHIDNAASRKVLESCGLQFTHFFEHDGEPHAWYAL